MAAESFFERWAKNNAEKKAVLEQEETARLMPHGQQEPAAEPPRVPTLEDAAQLTPQSDFTPFVARGVDEEVKRSALKKLFADPHFNVMDGLDVYIEDYNSFTPMTPAVLAALNHAKDLLDPLSRLEKPFMRLLEDLPPPAETSAQATTDTPAAPAEDTPAAEPGQDSTPPAKEPSAEPPQPDQDITASRPDDNPIQGL